MAHNIIRLIGLSIHFFIGALAYAASPILISPVDPVIESNQQATSVWLQNQGEAPIVMQIRAVSWQQTQFDDQYETAQQSLVASPPIATIPAGQRQLIRLVRGQTLAAKQEKAFRLIIDEIPQTLSNASSPSDKKQVGLQFQMRYSVPLFVAGEGIRLKDDSERKLTATPAKLTAKLLTVGGKPYLQVKNLGNIHARLSQVVWQQGVKNIVVSPGLLGYVLAGAEMRWPISANASSAGIIKAKINDQADGIIPLT